ERDRETRFRVRMYGALERVSRGNDPRRPTGLQRLDVQIVVKVPGASRQRRDREFGHVVVGIASKLLEHRGIRRQSSRVDELRGGASGVQAHLPARVGEELLYARA